MIYQPRNVQPSGVSIDGLLDNTFTMEIQTNSYVSAYQLLIVDFDNNEIYTGSKTTLTNYAYNGDILEIPVSASAVALSNGTNYKWRVRLYQPTADMLITYGLVQATSTTTTIYLQPNINIKAGMAITINSQTKTISSYNSDTGVAVVSSAFSSAPAVGTQYKIYSDFIETVPDYIVYARQTPAVAISNVPSSLTLKYHTFQGTYTQSDNVPIVYHKFDLYTRNDDGTTSLVASSDKVYSANLSYTYDSFRTGNKYLIQMTVENDMGVITTTDMYEFNVSYDIVEYLQQPLASFDDKNNAVKVSWVTPVEHDATSFRSDAATGIIQDNNNTLTQATFEPGQSIGEGDVVQITNSDCTLVIDGRSTQETTTGKNLLPNTATTQTISGLTFTKNEDGTILVNGTASANINFDVGTIDNLTLGNTYHLCGCPSGGSSSTYRLFMSDMTTGSTSEFGSGSNYTIQNTKVVVRIIIQNGTTVNNLLYKPMVSTDTTLTYDDYEPYTGGQPSPSPDYPSPIESIEEINIEVNSSNFINANNIKNSNIIISNDGAKITMPLITNGNGYTSTGSTLIQLCPNLKVGDVVYLNAETTSGHNKFAYLEKANKSWNFGTSMTLTKDMLDSVFVLYGNRFSSGETEQVDITNLRITKNINDSWEKYESNTTNINLQGNKLCSLPNGVKDELIVENGRAKINENVRHLSLAFADMNNNDNFPGWTNQTQLKNDWPGINTSFDKANINIRSNITNASNINLNTNKDGVIFFNKYFFGGMTQAEIKAKYNGLVLDLYYELATPTEIDLGDGAIPYIDGVNYMRISSNIDTTFSLVYPHKTISGNAYDYTEFNPPGVKQTGTIKSYNALTGVGILMAQYPFTYIPMQGDSYAVISNIYNVSGFSYLYNTPYNTVNSLYTHGYTATWATPDGLCVLPDDFNITLQFSPDGNFFYDQNGVYQEVVDLITTETDGANNEGEFTIKIDKNKLIFVQNPDISLELPFYTNTTQVFVLSSASVAQINNDYVWDDTATWTDTYTWVEGGTSLERVCNHWWKVQITNKGIKIEEIFPTT